MPFIITVDAALIFDQKILLVKRKKEPFENFWVLPGGHLEVSESILEAVVRETREETGISLNHEDFSFFHFLDDLDRNDPRFNKNLIRRISSVFIAEIKEKNLEEINAGSDAKEACLFSYDKIDFSTIGFDHMKVIEKLREKSLL